MVFLVTKQTLLLSAYKQLPVKTSETETECRVVKRFSATLSGKLVVHWVKKGQKALVVESLGERKRERDGISTMVYMG